MDLNLKILKMSGSDFFDKKLTNLVFLSSLQIHCFFSLLIADANIKFMQILIAPVSSNQTFFPQFQRTADHPCFIKEIVVLLNVEFVFSDFFLFLNFDFYRSRGHL